MEYLERLRKITETEMDGFIHGLEMPEEFRPKPKVELPPYDPTRPQFRILDHVRPTSQAWRELLGTLSLMRGTWTRSRRRQFGHFSFGSAQVQVLGRMHQGDDPRGFGTPDSSQEAG